MRASLVRGSNMDRRGFLSGLVGGLAVASAVRTWPFRVFSFPQEVVLNPVVEPVLLSNTMNSISSKYIIPVLADEIFRPSPLFLHLRRNGVIT